VIVSKCPYVNGEWETNMEILSLIYTKRIKTKIVSNFLVNECGFWHLEKCNTEVIYCESMKGV